MATSWASRTPLLLKFQSLHHVGKRKLRLGARRLPSGVARYFSFPLRMFPRKPTMPWMVPRAGGVLMPSGRKHLPCSSSARRLARTRRPSSVAWRRRGSRPARRCVQPPDISAVVVAAAPVPAAAIIAAVPAVPARIAVTVAVTIAHADHWRRRDHAVGRRLIAARKRRGKPRRKHPRSSLLPPMSAPSALPAAPPRRRHPNAMDGDGQSITRSSVNCGPRCRRSRPQNVWEPSRTWRR